MDINVKRIAIWNFSLTNNEMYAIINRLIEGKDKDPGDTAIVARFIQLWNDGITLKL